MRVVEDVFKRVDILEKKVAEKNKKSDFAIKIHESGYQLQQQAIIICNALAKIKDPRVESYRLRMMKILAEISRFN